MLVSDIENCVLNIHTKYDINRVISFWDIIDTGLENVVSRKTHEVFVSFLVLET